MGSTNALASIIYNGRYNPWLGLLGSIVSAALWFLFVEVVGIEWAVLSMLPEFMCRALNRERKSCLATIAKHHALQLKSSDSERLIDTAPHRPPTQQELISAYKFLGQLKARCAGLINAVFAVGLALAAIWDPILRSNPIYGVSSSWFVCACFISGYFTWDLYTVICRWHADGDSWQWLLHGLISLVALFSPFLAVKVPLSYYGALMVFLEISTPFMAFRWMAIKTKKLYQRENDKSLVEKAEWYVQAASLLFALTFFGVRIIWALAVLFLPLLRHLIFGELTRVMGPFRRWLYVGLIVIFYCLNVFWMGGIVNAALTTHKNPYRRDE